MASLAEAPVREQARTERRNARPLIATLPAVAWLLAFFAVPLVVFAVYSFLTNELYAVGLPFTLDGYEDALTSELNRTLARNSVAVGLTTSVVTVVVGMPIAFWLRFVARRSRLAVLFLITASMFASYLVRIYAWRTVLGSRGLINSALSSAGLIDQPLGFLLYSRFAVVVALVHIFLPYVVLVLYAGMGPLGEGLLEAAQDLGASSSLLWRRVIVPIMAAPAFSAGMFVFILAAADYVTPQFLGGKDGLTLGVQIQQNFIAVGNWPLAAATSFLMLLAFVLLFALGSFVLRRLRLNDIRLAS
jgi:spermidine/putrescine transport system permease protein